MIGKTQKRVLFSCRVRMPVDLWVPQMRGVIDKASLTNNIVYQGGGGVEIAGALQVIADLMLQSVTLPGVSGETYMALFPLNVNITDLQFTRLRGKGAFVVSAAWSATTGRLDGPVTIESEIGGIVSLELPSSHNSKATVTVADSAGKAVAAAQVEGRWSFATTAGETYTLMAAS